MTLRELLAEISEITSKDESLLDIPVAISASDSHSYAVARKYDGYHTFDRLKQGREIRLRFESEEGK